MARYLTELEVQNTHLNAYIIALTAALDASQREYPILWYLATMRGRQGPACDLLDMTRNPPAAVERMMERVALMEHVWRTSADLRRQVGSDGVFEAVMVNDEARELVREIQDALDELERTEGEWRSQHPHYLRVVRNETFPKVYSGTGPTDGNPFVLLSLMDLRRTIAAAVAVTVVMMVVVMMLFSVAHIVV